MLPEHDLLVIGEINPDLVLQGEDVTPAFGQAEKLVDRAALTIGSSSVIVACGAARLGLKTAFIGLVGDDLFGRFMLGAMQDRGVDTSGCTVTKAHQTGFSVILSGPNDRAILTFPGTIAELRHSDIDLGYLKRAKHLHLSSFFLLDNLRPDVPKLFRKAKHLGLTTSLDTNWDPRESWSGLSETLQYTDVLLPNEQEALHLTGQERLEPTLAILAKHVPTLAVKLGAEGAVARREGQEVRAPVVPVDVKDTTGAGDSFDAGFLYGYLQGWPLEKSLRFACACGSLSTRGVGGTDRQATQREALEALA